MGNYKDSRATGNESRVGAVANEMDNAHKKSIKAGSAFWEADDSARSVPLGVIELEGDRAGHSAAVLMFMERAGRRNWFRVE